MEKIIKVIRPISELQNTKPKLRVCAYCRVSTKQEDQNGSYETQKTYYEHYIKSNQHWEFAGIYADKGSGTSTKSRKAFNEMIDDCEDNKIDLIICKSISRFARNTLDTIKIARELRADGVYIIFEKENINTEKTESELAFNLLASFAQMESESISKNIKQSIRNGYKNGKNSISRVPYGYTKISKTELAINEKEAEVVRLIFKMYIDGYSCKKLSRYLIENKIDCNRTWGIAMITKNILKNKLYIGTMVLQKTINIESRKSIVNTGYAPRYEIENRYPQIVSKEVFEKANELLKENRRKKDEDMSKHPTVLGGKVICGHCGNSLGVTNYSFKAYLCHTRGCSKGKVGIEYIKENFVHLRNDLIANYESLLITDKITELKDDSQYNQKLNELYKQKDVIYRLKRDNIIDSAIFIEKINKIDTDIIKLEEEMQTLSFRNIDRQRKKLIKYMKKLSLTKKVETVFIDDEFSNLIDKVYVRDDVITYYTKLGTEAEYKNNYIVKAALKYGYTRVNGKIIVDDYEKDVVNYIFNEYIDGKSARDISNSLAEKGIKTKYGKPVWTCEVILNRIRSKSYLGDDTYPKLIEEQQFIKAQEILKANAEVRNERLRIKND